MIFLSLLLTVKNSYSQGYSFSNDATVIGFSKTHQFQDSESLIEIARKFNLGYNEIISSNPNLDPFLPTPGASVRIPTSWVLPDVASYDGIVINLSEMRLYYFFYERGRRLVKTFPIGIGREGYETPLGQYRIIQKTEKPSWYVPESIRAEKPELPKVVPPGPDNPLGTHAMRLSLSSYLIHGTNKPWAVGRRASHGCIRLYPEDIPVLFELVKNGSKVNIVRQAVKVGIKNKRVFIEIHEDDIDSYFGEAFALLTKNNLLQYIDNEKLYLALKQKSGEPVDISK